MNIGQRYLNSRLVFQLLKAGICVPGARWLLRQVLHREVEKVRSAPVPLSIILYVTNRCNARCAHCFYWEQLGRSEFELSLEEIGKLASSILSPLDTLSLTGGEPFLRADLGDICELFSRSCSPSKFVINTNGAFPDKVDTLLERFFDTTNAELSFHVSLDGPKELHNRIRGIDIYDKAMKTIDIVRNRMARTPHLELGILTTVTDYNISSMPEFMKDMAARFGIYPSLSPARSSDTDVHGLNGDIIEVAIPREESGRLSDQGYDHLIDLLGKRHDRIQTVMSAYDKVTVEYMRQIRQGLHPGFPCLAGKVDAVIYAEGDVAMCEFSKPFANLRNYNMDLRKLWSDGPAQATRRKLQACYCTHSCHLMNAMKYSTPALVKVLGS